MSGVAQLGRVGVASVALVMFGAWLTAVLTPELPATFVRNPARTAGRPADVIDPTERDAVVRLERAGLPVRVSELEHAPVPAHPQELRPHGRPDERVAGSPAWLDLAVVVGLTFGGAALLALMGRNRPQRRQPGGRRSAGPQAEGRSGRPVEGRSGRQVKARTQASTSLATLGGIAPRPEHSPRLGLVAQRTAPSVDDPGYGIKASAERAGRSWRHIGRSARAGVRLVGGALAWVRQGVRASARAVRRGVPAGLVALLDRRQQPVRPRSGWRQIAEQVHADLGGERQVLLEVADRIESSRGQLARQLRAASRPARFAAATLSALVPGVVVARGLTDPGYLSRLAAGDATLEVAAAVLLAVTGTWWLQRLAHPPFSPLPQVRRHYEREQAFVSQLGDVLDGAALCAAAGLDPQDALAHAASAEPDGPGARLARRLSSACSDQYTFGVSDRDTVGRCAQALNRWLRDGTRAPEALALCAAHLRREQEWAAWRRAGRWPAVLLIPLLAVIFPATALLIGQ